MHSLRAVSFDSVRIATESFFLDEYLSATIRELPPR